jgi:CheY-like chemotaxis protein
MKRVLVVDDDAPVRRIIRHHLVKDGFHVEEAENGTQARGSALGHGDTHAP